MGGLSGELARVHREEWGRIVSTLIRVTGDWSLAEDSTQDAFEEALSRWPRDGVPSNPGAWLTTVAKNRAIDKLRRRATEASKLQEVAMMAEDSEPLEDDRLSLIFTCCHPALTLEARVALTLRTVAGLTTPEIARAFLVPEATLAQRIVRAKSKIRNAGIPYRVPPGHLLAERLPGVLRVLYLLFTEGYSASSGDRVVREPLAEEAIRLARLLVALMPDEAEASGLLALMVLQHARRAARQDAAGDPVSIEDQDRTLWDADAIAEGNGILRAALRRHRVDSYQLQAVIASEHASSPSFAATDFRAIVRAYDDLARLDPSPVIAFNRAIAWGMAEGPAVGLQRLELIAASLEGYYLLPAARADFLRRLGRREAAAEQYERALALAPSEPETRFLERRLAEVTARE